MMTDSEMTVSAPAAGEKKGEYLDRVTALGVVYSEAVKVWTDSRSARGGSGYSAEFDRLLEEDVMTQEDFEDFLVSANANTRNHQSLFVNRANLVNRVRSSLVGTPVYVVRTVGKERMAELMSS